MFRSLMGLTAAVALSMGSSAMAASVGLNFVGGGTPGGGSLTAAEVAGAPGYSQANWNNLLTDWSGDASNDALFASGLKDSNGNTVAFGVGYAPGASDPIHYDAANVWGTGIASTTANNRLMRGYLDSNDGNSASQPFAEIKGIPYAKYDVVVYVDGDVTNGQLGQYWLEAFNSTLLTSKVYVNDVGNFSGTFVQAIPSTVQGSGGTGNYLVFRGLTATEFRLRGDQGNGTRSPLNAFQIVEVVPEPATAMLGLGSLMVLGLRRRRSV